MLKECTLLTFDETLENGKNGDDDPTNACVWGVGEAREIRKRFD